MEYFSTGHPKYANELRNVKIALAALKKLEARFSQGFYDAVCERGKIEGDSVFIHMRDYQELRAKFAGKKFFAPTAPQITANRTATPSPYFSIPPQKGCGSCGRK